MTRVATIVCLFLCLMEAGLCQQLGPRHYNVSLAVMGVGQLSRDVGTFECDIVVRFFCVNDSTYNTWPYVPPSASVSQHGPYIGRVFSNMIKDGSIWPSSNSNSTKPFYRIKGTFFYKTDTTYFPFNSEALTIIVEDLAHTNDEVILWPAALSAEWEKYAGYFLYKRYTGFTTRMVDGQKFSRIYFTFEMRRWPLSMIVQYFMPPILMYAVQWCSSMLHVEHVLTRFNLAGGTLIASVLFHSSVLKDVPPSENSTLVDFELLIIYVVTALNFISALILSLMVSRNGLAHAKSHVFNRLQRVVIPLWTPSLWVLVAMRIDGLFVSMAWLVICVFVVALSLRVSAVAAAVDFLEKEVPKVPPAAAVPAAVPVRKNPKQTSQKSKGIAELAESDFGDSSSSDEEEESKEKAAATKIQAVLRGRRARREYERQRSIMEDAAAKIQRLVRLRHAWAPPTEAEMLTGAAPPTIPDMPAQLSVRGPATFQWPLDQLPGQPQLPPLPYAQPNTGNWNDRPGATNESQQWNDGRRQSGSFNNWANFVGNGTPNAAAPSPNTTGSFANVTGPSPNTTGPSPHPSQQSNQSNRGQFGATVKFPTASPLLAKFKDFKSDTESDLPFGMR